MYNEIKRGVRKGGKIQVKKLHPTSRENNLAGGSDLIRNKVDEREPVANLLLDSSWIRIYIPVRFMGMKNKIFLFFQLLEKKKLSNKTMTLDIRRRAETIV